MAYSVICVSDLGPGNQELEPRPARLGCVLL